MSATSYISSTIVSRPPLAQHIIVEPTVKGGICSPVCTYCDSNVLGNIFGNDVPRIVKFIIETLRILLSSRNGFQMPEGGDVDVLNPSVSRGVGVLARRRIGLSLDFSDISSEDLVSKKCKIESMNIQITAANYTNSGLTGTTHRMVLPADLAHRMKKCKAVLVLDCRPFFAYNANHIQGAVNINCSDRFNRRRLVQGKCSLVDLISSKEGKDLYKKRSSKDIVVVYDDRTKDIKDVATDSSMYIVMSVLRREGKQPAILKGGLDDFLVNHEDLCKSSLKAQEHKPLYSPTTPIIEPAIETAIASEILDFLYLGNERDAANLQRLNDLGITYVLNVTSHIPLHFEKHGIKYKRIPASDSGQQNLRQYFEEAANFIGEAREAGAKILVHCQAGVSRSATITIAFLLLHSRMTMTDAYRFVKTKRHIISPNFNFMGQLLDFEQALNQGKISRILTPCIEEVETFI